MQEANLTPLHTQSIKDLLSSFSTSSPQKPAENGIKDHKGNIRLDPDWNLKEHLSSDEQRLLNYGVR